MKDNVFKHSLRLPLKIQLKKNLQSTTFSDHQNLGGFDSANRNCW